MRKLGKVQAEVLESLVRHGSWHIRCGWVWDEPANTQRLMDSLVRAGRAVVAREGGWSVYRPAKPTRVVVLSDGRAVDADDVRAMLKKQHAILLKLSKDLAKDGHGAGSPAQAAIGDANMLGLEVADRWGEL